MSHVEHGRRYLQQRAKILERARTKARIEGQDELAQIQTRELMAILRQLRRLPVVAA